MTPKYSSDFTLRDDRYLVMMISGKYGIILLAKAFFWSVNIVGASLGTDFWKTFDDNY